MKRIEITKHPTLARSEVLLPRDRKSQVQTVPTLSLYGPFGRGNPEMIVSFKEQHQPYRQGLASIASSLKVVTVLPSERSRAVNAPQYVLSSLYACRHDPIKRQAIAISARFFLDDLVCSFECQIYIDSEYLALFGFLLYCIKPETCSNFNGTHFHESFHRPNASGFSNYFRVVNKLLIRIPPNARQSDSRAMAIF
jgi:hypothetical protein